MKAETQAEVESGKGRPVRFTLVLSLYLGLSLL